MNMRECWSCLLRFLSDSEEIPGMCRLNFLLEEGDARTAVTATGECQDGWCSRVLAGLLRRKNLGIYLKRLNNNGEYGPNYADIF